MGAELKKKVVIDWISLVCRNKQSYDLDNVILYLNYRLKEIWNMQLAAGQSLQMVLKNN